MMLRRTIGDIIDIAARTPLDVPVGLTHLEWNVVTSQFNGAHFGQLLMGRRVVLIPHDWERNW